MIMMIDRLTFSLHFLFLQLFLLQCLQTRLISYMHNMRPYSKSINYYSNPTSMGDIIHDSYGGKVNPCNGHYQSKPGYWAKAISTTCFWLLGINLLFLLAHSSCSVLIRNVGFPCKEGPFLPHLIEALAWLVMFLSTRSSSTQLRSSSYSSLLRVWWAASFLFSFYSFILHIQSLSTHSTSSSISDNSSDSSISNTDSDSDGSTVSIDLWASMLSLPAVSFLAVVSVYGKTGHSEFSVRAEKSGYDGDYVSPYYSVGFLSRLTLSWLNPLVSVGSGKALEMRDIPHLSSIDRAEAAYVKLKENWAKLSMTNYNRKRSSSSSRSDSSISENSSRSSSGCSKSISSSRTSSSSINSSSSISVSSGRINNSSSSSSDICSRISSGLGSNDSSSIIISSSDISSRSIDSIHSGSSNRSIGSNDSSGMISNSTTTTTTTTVTYSSSGSSTYSSSRTSSIGSTDGSSSTSNNSSSSSSCCSDRSSDSSSSSSSCSTNSGKSNSSPLGWAIVLTFKREAAYTAIFAGLNTLASYVGPYLVDDFVKYLNGRRRFEYEGYALASFFFLSKLIETLSQRQWHLGINLLGMQIRSSLTALLYWKGLRLGSCQNNHNSGKIINYITFDVERIADYSSYLHQIWLLPLQITLALSILHRNVGLAACIATLVATLISIVSNTPIVKLQEQYQELLMVAKDERMRATTECLRSMRILKLQAWEKMYYKKLCKLRNMEYTCLQKAIYTQSAVSFVFSGAPIFVSVVSFGTCLVVGIPLTSGRVLSALATFRVLQEPLQNFPDLVAVITQTRVSLDRLFGFLQEDELQKENNISHCIIDKLPAESCKLAIDIKEGEFSWNPPITCGLSTLSGINLSLSKGMRVVVCGMVGSGKSSFLSCLLGEMPRISGTAKICGRIAYVSQSAWIQTTIIQDNILFGKSMDKSKYENVLRVCDLQKDLHLLANGDQTMIGERGINLSGGQKQRVQLARALYQDADIYLLDDPFSALDAHTGSQLFKEYILGALAFKTVLYVTHQVEFLPESELILVLRNGKVIQAGKYKELQQAGMDFKSLVCAHNEAIKAMDVAKTILEEADAGDSHANSIRIMDISKHHGGQQGFLEGEKDPFVRLRIEKKGFSIHKGKRKQIIQEEEMEKGSVKFYVYWSYMTAEYKGVLVPVILLAQASYQLLQISSNWWMAWASPALKGKPFRTGSVKLMLVYMALSFSSAPCIFIRAVLVTIFGMKASQKLFTSMQKCIFRAPMAFFDSTPTGRILNRVSVDQSVVDLDIPFKLSSFAATTIQLLGIVGEMTQVTWQVLFLFVPVAAASLWMQKYYMASAQELTRLVGIQKSPIIHHFSESISGVATIRGFKEEQRYQRTMLSLIDLYARPYFHNFVAIEWLCLRIELLSTFVFAFMMFLLVRFAPGTVDARMAGLAVSYGLTLNSRQSCWVLSLCKLQNKVISIERIQQYTCIPSEAPLVIEDSRPPKKWPSLGSVEFHQLKVRYSEKFPVVLHGISCNFPGGKKIGVVGRTGSGKSTLIQALFRMVEAMEGRILIDGYDIAKIGLHDLRSRLNIIPQDPTLFEGTMRSNLDPLGDHSDSEIWETLDKCQLGDVVRSKEGKLDTIVTENGVNWSVGQRQLVCLGRVLLRHTRILVLDEATASVDTATDGLVQRVIHNEFQDSTIITVAHRIPTIIDSDLVLVLSDGRIAEYDSPAKLLEDKSSLFFKLVSEYSLRSSSFSDAAYTNRGSFNKTPTCFQAPLR